MQIFHLDRANKHCISAFWNMYKPMKRLNGTHGAFLACKNASIASVFEDHASPKILKLEVGVQKNDDEIGRRGKT
jgi:hypothetical protein